MHNSRDSITILKFSTFLVWRKPAQVHILRLKMGLFVVSIQDGRHGVVVHRVRVELWATRGRCKERAHIIIVGTYTFNFKDLLWDDISLICRKLMISFAEIGLGMTKNEIHQKVQLLGVYYSVLTFMLSSKVYLVNSSSTAIWCGIRDGAKQLFSLRRQWGRRRPQLELLASYSSSCGQFAWYFKNCFHAIFLSFKGRIDCRVFCKVFLRTWWC